MAKEEFALNGNDYFAKVMIDGAHVKKYESEGWKISMIANGVTYEFGKSDGLRWVDGPGNDMITKFPTPNFWSAPTTTILARKHSKNCVCGKEVHTLELSLSKE